MPVTLRSLVKLAAAAPFLAAGPMPGAQPAADDSLRSELRLSAGLLGLPGFVARVIRGGKLSFVHADGFADLESRTPMRQDHTFYVASLTKTFTAVMMMPYVQEKKISLHDYVLDYPFLSVGLTPDGLSDPGLRPKHVLSHTSEGKPGDNFIYNGNLYSFVYGAFEKFSRNTQHYQACAQEFRKRVEEPLGLTSTLSGYPRGRKGSAFPELRLHTSSIRDIRLRPETAEHPAR